MNYGLAKIAAEYSPEEVAKLQQEVEYYRNRNQRVDDAEMQQAKATLGLIGGGAVTGAAVGANHGYKNTMRLNMGLEPKLVRPLAKASAKSFLGPGALLGAAAGGLAALPVAQYYDEKIDRIHHSPY